MLEWLAGEEGYAAGLRSIHGANGKANVGRISHFTKSGKELEKERLRNLKVSSDTFTGKTRE